MLRVSGEVVRFEKKPWTMEGRSGITKTARVQTTRADFVDVKLGEDVSEPREGDLVDWAVTPGVSGGRVSVNHKGDWAAVLGSFVPVPLVSAAKHS